MKEKILLSLKTKFAGVQDAILNRVAEKLAKTVKEETEVATAVEGVTLQSLIDSYGDSRATEATQTAVKTFREKHGLGEDGKPIKKDPDPKPDPKSGDPKPDPDMPEWAKKLAADNEELRKKIETQELEKTSSLLIDKVRKHEKLKDIPASFLKGRNLKPNSEGEIDNLVADLRTDYDTFYQEQVEAGVIVSIPKSSPEGNKEGEKLGKDAAKKRNENASEGVKAKAI